MFGVAGFMGRHLVNVRRTLWWNCGLRPPGIEGCASGDAYDDRRYSGCCCCRRCYLRFWCCFQFRRHSRHSRMHRKTNRSSNYQCSWYYKPITSLRWSKCGALCFLSSLYVYSRVGGIDRTTKKACEELIEEYSQQFGLPYIILRFGTIYGPTADHRNSIHRYFQLIPISANVRYAWKICWMYIIPG